MKVHFYEPIFQNHKEIIRRDNCRVSEVFEVLLLFCTLGLILVSIFEDGYGIMNEIYLIYAIISFVLFGITRFYVRKHLEFENIIMFAVMIEAYSYSVFSGILFNKNAPSITVYALMVAACSAYLVPFLFTVVFHTAVAAIYCSLALILKPEYGVQDTINYVIFLSMSFVLTLIIYKTRLAYLDSIDDAMEQKEIALERVRLQKELEAQRRQANEDLMNSQKTFQVALDTAKVLAWRYDYKTKCITDSSTLGTEYHLPKVVENVPQTILDMNFIQKESEADFLKLYEGVQKEEITSVDVLTTVPREDGFAWYRQIYTPMYDSDGNYIDAIGIAIEITDQKKREHRYEELLQLSKAATQDAIAIASYNLTQNTVTEYASDYKDLTSLKRHKTADEMLGSTQETIRDPEERKKFAAAFNSEALLQAFKNGETHIEITHHLQDNTRWMQTTFDMIKNPYTEDIEAISALYDITDSVRGDLIASQLLAVDYQSVMLIDVNSGNIVPFREEGSDTNLNEVMELQREKQDSQMGLEEFLMEYAVPGTAERAIEENRLGTVIKELKKNTYYETLYALIQDGKKSWFRTMYSYLKDEKELILCAVQDVTEIYEQEEKQKIILEKALSEAEAANVAKTAFLSRVSHDMRTPLNGILGLTSFIKSHVEDENVTSDLNELEISGKYLLNLINDTLDVSRIESGKLELHPSVCDGNKVFGNVIALMKAGVRGKSITLNMQVDELPSTMIYTDTGRMEQVIMNVYGNAVKFTPPEGTIDVLIKNISIEDGMIVNQFIIQDSGIGMSSEFVPHIFEAFSQEDASRTSIHKGTGLGMAITKQILNTMGGDIQIESELGKGTRVAMTIPMQVATDEQVDEFENAVHTVLDEEKLKGKRVLLCEDHPLNATIATRLLTAKGMLVEHAENGEIGVEDFMCSDSNYYDVVLMDIRMPVLDGIDAAKAIRGLSRADAKTVPIIAMTANAFADDIAQTLDAGMNEHLSKPIQPEILYRTLQNML